MDHLFQGVMPMEESVSYQAFLKNQLANAMKQGLEQGWKQGRAEGAVQGARKIVLVAGNSRFGIPANRQTRAALEAISDVEGLEQLALRIREVQSWEELLPPAPRRL